MAANLVHSLEDARREQQLIETLRRSVRDADELCRKMGAPSPSNGVSSSSGASPALKRKQDISRFCTKTVEQVMELERTCASSYLHLRRFHPAKFLEDTKQQVPMKQLVKPTDTGSTEALDRMVDAVSRLKAHPMARPLKDGSPNPVGQFLDRGLSTLRNCVTLVQNTSVECNMWAGLSDALLVLTEEVLGLPVIATLLDEEHETIRRMNFAVEECQQQQQEAVEQGDMKQSEVLYFKTITLQEAMTDVFNKMQARLDEQHQESFTDPQKRVHEVHQRANADVSAIIHRNDTLKKKIDADVKNLVSTFKAVQEEDAEIQKAFLKLKNESDQYLRDNQAQQEQVLVAIDELERQLTKLGQERTEALDRRLSAIEEEGKRRADVNHFSTFVTNHKELLENTLHQIEICEEVTDYVDEVLCAGCNAIEQRTRQFDGEIETERMRANESRLAHFRQLYLTIGDLQYKKERNMEELGKKIEAAHIQQELAMDTFNPKAKEYSNAKKELIKMQEDLQAQITVLGDKAVLHIEAFKPTEQALLDAGKEFVHPVEELANRNRTRQQKLLEYHQLMTEGEPAVDTAHLDDEKRQIDQDREVIKSMPRRPLYSRGGGRDGSGSEGFSNPNSPTKNIGGIDD